MTATHDKEWKIWCYDCKKLVTFYYRSDDCCPECHQGNIYHIHNEALDQLRREQQEADKLWWASMVDKVKLEAIRNYKNSSEFISERNELKKELLDEFKSFLDNYHNLENKFYAFRYIAENKVAYYRYDGLLKQFELFRAKTLGKKNK